MLVSVIVPTFNRQALLMRALHSINNQAPAEYLGEMVETEIIVVDDGSTDDTKAMIGCEFPEVRYIYQNNHGVSAARNVGISKSIGEWIALLDSDDEWLPEKLQKQFSLLEQTGLAICHTQENWLRNGKPLKQLKKHHKRGGWIFEDCLPLCAMSPSSIVLKRELFDDVGVFDESLPACEDYDLWLRLTSRYPVAYEPSACIIKYGGHQDQLSQKYWGMDRFRVIALEKILQQNLTDEYHQAAADMLESKLSILLKGAYKHDNQALIDYCQVRISKSNHGQTND